MNYPTTTTPSARVAESGPASVSDVELLAVIAGVAASKASDLLVRFGSLGKVLASTQEETSSVAGIGPATAARLASVNEVWRRIARANYSKGQVASPEDVMALIGHEMQWLTQESVRAVFLDHRRCLIRVEEIFRGTGNECMVNPKEILRRALTLSAHALIMVHNHPSGNPQPSEADHHVTRTLKAACQTLSVELTDHMVIGKPGDWGPPYFSFRESGLL